MQEDLVNKINSQQATSTTTSATILASTTIYDGLAGDYPVETLERQWGVKRREDKKEQRFFNRRRSIFTVINNLAQRRYIIIETAANVAKERCSRLNKFLHHLAELDDQIIE